MNIIFISQRQITTKLPLIWINTTITFIDDYHLKTNDKLYQFDYLIIDDLSLILNITKLNILIDDDKLVTNCYFQTSLEHIYYLDNQDINIIINHLLFKE